MTFFFFFLFNTETNIYKKEKKKKKKKKYYIFHLYTCHFRISKFSLLTKVFNMIIDNNFIRITPICCYVAYRTATRSSSSCILIFSSNLPSTTLFYFIPSFCCFLFHVLIKIKKNNKKLQKREAIVSAWDNVAFKVDMSNLLFYKYKLIYLFFPT